MTPPGPEITTRERVGLDAVESERGGDLQNLAVGEGLDPAVQLVVGRSAGRKVPAEAPDELDARHEGGGVLLRVPVPGSGLAQVAVQRERRSTGAGLARLGEHRLQLALDALRV